MSKMSRIIATVQRSVMVKTNVWWWWTMVMMVVVTSADRIPGVCEDATPLANQPTRPAVPKQFKALVECQMLDRNQSISVYEWYDYVNNKARIHQQDLTDNGDFFYDYAQNELLLVDRLQNGFCEVLTLAGSDENFVFGVTSSSGREHVLTPSAALHFGSSPQLYQGNQQVIRGIHVSKWTSCQYSSLLDATMNVTWYFSDNKSWDMQVGAAVVPVRAEVVGRRNDPGAGNHAFHHIYDLFDFQLTVDPADFQLHEGDYCPGRVTKKPFPKLADIFSINAERIHVDTARIEWIEEHYDNIHKLNVYVYKDYIDRKSLTGAREKLEINDFAEGYAYMIDKKEGTCKVDLVSEGNFAYDTNKAGTVSQQTSREFFDVSNIAYEYGGVKTMRGIPVDTWVARAPGFAPENVTVEWSFATKDLNDPNVMLDSYQVPVAFRVWGPNGKSKGQVMYEYNAFAFSQNRPLLADLDISNCFHGVDRVNLRFTISGSQHDKVFQDVQTFKAAVMTAIGSHLGISPLRVSDVQLYVESSDITVSMDVVDRPSFSGDSPTDPNPQASLTQAVNVLTSSPGVNTLSFPVTVNKRVANVKPVENSGVVFFTNGTSQALIFPTSSQFSTGAFAGLGVAMLLVGGGIGGSGGFLLFRRKSA